MKKHIKTRRLNRDSQSRKALFQNLVNSMIEHEEIETTSAKARAVQGIFEKLITKARLNTVHATRQVHSTVQDRTLVHKLVTKIAPRYKGVKGGYTKIIMVGNRRGDNAPIVKLALTKKQTVKESLVEKKPKASKKLTKKSTKATKKPIAKQAAKPATPQKARSTSTNKSTTHVRKQGDR